MGALVVIGVIGGIIWCLLSIVVYSLCSIASSADRHLDE